MKHKSKQPQTRQFVQRARLGRRAKANLKKQNRCAAETSPHKSLPACAGAPGGDRNGGDVVHIYFREVGHYPLLEQHELAPLIRRMRAGDEVARERLITSHLRLVVKIARGFDGLGVPLLDLISEGNIGLMKAVDRFKSEKGSSLVVYASFWIKQRIRLALANHSRTIRVPMNVHAKLIQLRRAAAQLHNLLGREPSEEEVSQALRIPTDRLSQWQEAGRATVSLDQPLTGNDDLSVGGLIADGNARTPHESLAHAQSLEVLRLCIASLDARAQRVLEWRFGLNGQRKRTLNQIGAHFGVSRERIRQIQNEALAALKGDASSREFVLLCA